MIRRILKVMTAILTLLPKRLSLLLYELNSNTNCTWQIALRYCIVGSLCKTIGHNVYIGKRVTLKNIKNITIGDNVSIHDMCYIDGYGGIKIGNNVSIAHNTSILTSTHTWSDQSIPIKYNQVIAGKVVIEDDVWIGCAVRILYKVTIGQRSVIAAGTVVTTNLQSGWLGAGIPMKHKKKLEDW
ncbi:acyltransferase [Staphylococcus arlettae]|uniref:acyltransferase n=1 Tax=Staphylococcus arlettae TaxID=29378 RepID=UPI000E698785|nr:acyltransferase [Staphylococcus arlettae]RIM58580.1 acyltransferase [Staphylococcus arlettae]